MLINFHDSSLITTSVTVIGSTENCYDIPILTPVVPFHNQLMRSRNQSKAIVVVESFTDILTKGVPRSSWAYTPSTSIIGIRPEKVTHRSFMRDFLNTIQASDVVECID